VPCFISSQLCDCAVNSTAYGHNSFRSPVQESDKEMLKNFSESLKGICRNLNFDKSGHFSLEVLWDSLTRLGRPADGFVG
jgi:hypothetical protein